MEKVKNIFGRNMAKLLVFLIGGILVLGLLSYGLLTLSKTVAGQGHKIEICTYYQDNSTKNLSSLAGTISVNGNISDSVQGRVGSSVSLSATPNENYQFMGFYRDLEFTDVISRDSSCVYEIDEDDAKIFAQFLKVYPVSFTFQDSNFSTHTITKKFPYGYTFGQEEIKELIEQEAGEAGLSVFENKLAKLNPSPETAPDTTHTNMCFTVGSGASFFNLTPAPLDDVGISGSGTSASPYLIANATDLATFRNTVNGTKYDAHGKLTANITLSGNWTPIGNYSANTAYQYKGTFDGQFYSISGLSISSSNSYQGLFGLCSGATVKNLKILGGGVSQSNSTNQTYYCAALSGALADGTKVINCLTTCSVSSNSQELGGVCGAVKGTGAILINCMNGGTIKSTQTGGDCEIAGICGNTGADNLTFYNCYNYGAVDSGTSSEAARGGIIGENCQGAEITKLINCYSMSGVAGNKVYSYGTNGIDYTILKGNSLFNASTQVITPFDSGVTTRYVYNIATDAATSMPATTTLLEALNKFVELNPVMEGVNLSSWHKPSTYPEFGASVTYNANNGSGAPSKQSSSNSSIKISSTEPTRTGYTFKGWGTTSSTTTVSYSSGSTYTFLGEVTVYAVWKANTYTIVYNANGGLGSMSNSSHTYDTAKNLTANAYTKQGYIFLGWSTSSTAINASYTNQQSVKNLTTTANGTVTLYAVWGYNYAVHYNGNGATGGSTARSIHTFNSAEALTVNGFTRTGYTFVGWSMSSAATTATYTDKESVTNLTTTQYETVILYAVWQGNSYTVHYHANGGSGSMENSSHVYGTESKLRENTFTKDGYVFLGWNEDQNATIETYNDKEKISTLTATANATVTLYAIWLKKDITVTVDPNGGVYNGVETATVYNCSVGSDLVLGVPSRPGYEFTEFNTQGDGLGQTLNGTMVLNGDVTFYALWEPLNYYINYYDGDLYLGQTVAWYNENLSLPRWETLLSNNSLTGGKFTQYGWNFAGWTSDANGSTIQHTNGGAVMNLAEAGTTINLYAMHTQTLNLTYNGNGSTSGNVANQSSDLMLNSKSEKITNFVITLANNSYAKTNYSFKNWAIGSTSGTQKSAGANITNVDLGLTYSSTFNKTIYAIWQGNSYTINYYNGTTKISTGNYVYGNSATLKNFSTIGTVTNLAYGWEFYGWATANNTFTRVFEDSANITNISVENGAEITQNMVIDLYSIYSREVSFVSGLNKASTTTATQFWNPYSTENSNLSSVLAEAPQTIETGNWTTLGYRSDITADTATFALTITTEIRPAVNAFNTLYAVYSRTITIADLNTTTTATQYYNSAGTTSTFSV